MPFSGAMKTPTQSQSTILVKQSPQRKNGSFKSKLNRGDEKDIYISYREYEYCPVTMTGI